MTLATARALGETVAVAMVIGLNPLFPPSLFSTASTLASTIAVQFQDATSLQVAALGALAVILMALTAIVNWIGRRLIRHGLGRGGIHMSAQVIDGIPPDPMLERRELVQRVAHQDAEAAHARLERMVVAVRAGARSSPSFLLSRSCTRSWKRDVHWWSLDFFTKTPQFPSLLDPNAIGGISNAIIGSLVIDGIAALFADPDRDHRRPVPGRVVLEVRERAAQRRPRS